MSEMTKTVMTVPISSSLSTRSCSGFLAENPTHCLVSQRTSRPRSQGFTYCLLRAALGPRNLSLGSTRQSLNCTGDARRVFQGRLPNRAEHRCASPLPVANDVNTIHSPLIPGCGIRFVRRRSCASLATESSPGVVTTSERLLFRATGQRSPFLSTPLNRSSQAEPRVLREPLIYLDARRILEVRSGICIRRAPSKQENRRYGAADFNANSGLC
jgi:hypothetical protein